MRIFRVLKKDAQNKSCAEILREKGIIGLAEGTVTFGELRKEDSAFYLKIEGIDGESDLVEDASIAWQPVELTEVYSRHMKIFSVSKSDARGKSYVEILREKGFDEVFDGATIAVSVSQTGDQFYLKVDDIDGKSDPIDMNTLLAWQNITPTETYPPAPREVTAANGETIYGIDAISMPYIGHNTPVNSLANQFNEEKAKAVATHTLTDGHVPDSIVTGIYSEKEHRVTLDNNEANDRICTFSTIDNQVNHYINSQGTVVYVRIEEKSFKIFFKRQEGGCYDVSSVNPEFLPKFSESGARAAVAQSADYRLKRQSYLSFHAPKSVAAALASEVESNEALRKAIKENIQAAFARKEGARSGGHGSAEDANSPTGLLEVYAKQLTKLNKYPLWNHSSIQKLKAKIEAAETLVTIVAPTSEAESAVDALYANPERFQALADAVHKSKGLKKALMDAYDEALSVSTKKTTLSLDKSRKVLEALREVHKADKKAAAASSADDRRSSEESNSVRRDSK